MTVGKNVGTPATLCRKLVEAGITCEKMRSDSDGEG